MRDNTVLYCDCTASGTGRLGRIVTVCLSDGVVGGPRDWQTRRKHAAPG